MLSFIWHLRGSVRLVGAQSDEAALYRLRQLLDRERKTVSQQGSGWLLFEQGPVRLFEPSWLPLTIYDRGRFWIAGRDDHRLLCYDLRCLHALVFCLLAAMLFFTFGWLNGGLAHALGYAGFAFAWLYGLNMVLALGRVPRSIRKAVLGA